MQEEKYCKDLINKRNDIFERKANIKSGLDCQNYAIYIEFLNEKIETETVKLNTLKEKFEEKKKELLKSTSDRKVLEKLKDKAKAEFEFEENKKEQKLNDDFALFSYVRKGRR